MSERFRIRTYEPADDEGAKALELSGGFVTPKNAIGRALIRGSFTHHYAFDAKAVQFKESHVIVCEDAAPPPGEPRIVGVVMLAIKSAVLHDRPIKLAYTFDLRVHGACQRSGIGRRLCAEVERLCRAAGVHTSYLSVNGDNERAKALYKSLGYTFASKRAPKMDFLVRQQAVWPPTRPRPDVSITKLTREEAVRVLLATHGRRDCALDEAGMRALLLEHPAYEASFAATTSDGASAASVHLWNGSHLGSLSITRLLIPTVWLDSPILLTALAALGAALAGGYWRWLARHGSAGNYVTAAIAAVAASAVAYGAWKAAPTARLVRRTLAKSNYPEMRCRSRARLFAPAHSGPDGDALLAALVRHVKNEAMESGFDYMVINLDAEDPIRGTFGTPSFFTVFYQKQLQDEAAASGRRFGVDAFHDPRDIS